MADKSWACMLKCVEASTRKKKATRQSGPRLTDEAVRAIRASDESLRVLSIRYDRDKRVIGNVKNGRSYKAVK